MSLRPAHHVALLLLAFVVGTGIAVSLSITVAACCFLGTVPDRILWAWFTVASAVGAATALLAAARLAWTAASCGAVVQRAALAAGEVALVLPLPLLALGYSMGGSAAWTDAPWGVAARVWLAGVLVLPAIGALLAIGVTRAPRGA